jgi:putative ATPase
MTDLFDQAMQQRMTQEAPLAARMRPRTLDEFVGQEPIIAPANCCGAPLKPTDCSLPSCSLDRPVPEKTTLARLIAQHSQAHFEAISAVLAGVADLRKVIAEATERRKMYHQRTILFVDEVHRWNKAQQDALLPHVESGMVTLIGATTENPYFEVIRALVSRSRIFEMQPLNEEQLGVIIDRTLVRRGTRLRLAPGYPG